MFLISLLFTLLIQHHLSWASKLWKADRQTRRVLDRGAKSDSDFDSPFWDCQSVACNVSWHFTQSSSPSLNALSSILDRISAKVLLLVSSNSENSSVKQKLIGPELYSAGLLLVFWQKSDFELIFNLVKYTQSCKCDLKKKSISVKLWCLWHWQTALLHLICITCDEQKTFIQLIKN